jgi:DGQHR domain-containing protein
MTNNTVTFIAEQTANLDTVCYRGSAPLSELARISQADVFDQESNPDGLQRDLSKKHAAEAYDYVAREASDDFPRAFPEVVLNARDKNVVTVEQIKLPADVPVQLVKLTVDLDKIERAKTVKISRVDGNHRLMFGAGDDKDRGPVELQAPFQMHLGLTREQEASLFVDINASQKGLNTSHIAYLRSQLTPDEVEMLHHQPRWIARQLATDAASPFNGLVHMGGSKQGTRAKGIQRPINFTTLESACKRLVNKSQYLSDLKTPQARYGIIRNYFKAAQATWPQAFAEPAEYLLIKGTGLLALGSFGAAVIDRCMASGEVSQDDLEVMLAPAKDVYDWSRNAAKDGIVGMSGNRAALLISGELADKLPKSPLAERERRNKAREQKEAT